jgi:ribosome-binding factor A
MQTLRREKVAELLIAEISDILRTRVKDPRLGFITITGVVMTSDLRIAKVYFSVLGDETQKANTVTALESARTFIQSEVGSRIRLRFLPELRFYPDKSWEYGMRIESLIHQLHANDKPNDE